MYEVTIPLRPVPFNEVGHPKDYFNIIREEYADRYLEMLNIASTAANKAEFMRGRMLDDCDIMAIWPDMRHSALADAIRIVPPMRMRIGDMQDFDESDRNMFAQWYGEGSSIHVRPPDIGASHGKVKLDAGDDDRAEEGLEAGGGNSGPSGSLDAAKSEVTAQPLSAELERVRIAGGGAEVGKRIGVGSSRLDAERRDRLKEELVLLKAKFILPFACERSAKDGSLSGPSRKSELLVWPMEGPLNIDSPEEMQKEVFQPIRVALEDVRKNTAKWVDEHMPLELLTSRRDENLWEDVRETLRHPDVARLIGLLAHLLHWVALMPLREDGPTLSESALQSLFVSIHQNWAQFEKLYRNTKTGVNFGLPCLMLTVKRGIERCFEISYPTLMSDEVLRQQVLDRINTLLMRLFDPDGMYSRFGKLDGEGRAMVLSKKLDAMMASQGSTRVKRLHGRLHRATPLVRAVLGLTGTQEHRGTVADTKTRVLMLKSDNGGTVPTGNVVNPPQDSWRQSALLMAAKSRLPINKAGEHLGLSEGSTRQPLSARPSQSTRRREAKTSWDISDSATRAQVAEGTRNREAKAHSPQQSPRGGEASNGVVGNVDGTVSARSTASGLGALRFPGTGKTTCAGAGAPARGDGGGTSSTTPKSNASPKALDQTRLPLLPRPPRHAPT